MIEIPAFDLPGKTKKWRKREINEKPIRSTDAKIKEEYIVRSYVHIKWYRKPNFTLLLLLLLRRQDMKMTLGYGHRQTKIIELACFLHVQNLCVCVFWCFAHIRRVTLANLLSCTYVMRDRSEARWGEAKQENIQNRHNETTKGIFFVVVFSLSRFLKEILFITY